MAVTVVNLSDPISTLVTKTNTVASDLGDRASLSTTDKTSLVAAINEINSTTNIATQVETFFHTQGNVLDVRGFHADSANIDSATITSLASTTVHTANLSLDGVSTLSNVKSLSIKDSTGSVVLAGYLLSTSNTDGTL